MDPESSQKQGDSSGFPHCRKVSVFTVSCELCTRKRGKSVKAKLNWQLGMPPIHTSTVVVPLAVTAGDKIEGLRQWASGRCLSADRAGVYSRSEEVGGRERRVVRAD
jgi:hypothetical protein